MGRLGFQRDKHVAMPNHIHIIPAVQEGRRGRRPLQKNVSKVFIAMSASLGSCLLEAMAGERRPGYFLFLEILRIVSKKNTAAVRTMIAMLT